MDVLASLNYWFQISIKVAGSNNQPQHQSKHQAGLRHLDLPKQMNGQIRHVRHDYVANLL